MIPHYNSLDIRFSDEFVGRLLCFERLVSTLFTFMRPQLQLAAISNGGVVSDRNHRCLYRLHPLRGK